MSGVGVSGVGVGVVGVCGAVGVVVVGVGVVGVVGAVDVGAVGDSEPAELVVDEVEYLVVVGRIDLLADRPAHIVFALHAADL